MFFKHKAEFYYNNFLVMLLFCTMVQLWCGGDDEIPDDQFLQEEEVLLPITNEERQAVLKAIKEIAPVLHNAIIKVDPTGEKHIDRGRYLKISGSTAGMDGLPVLSIDSTFVKQPWKDILFLVANTLAHYALKNIFESQEISHRSLSKDITEPQEFKKGKMVAGQLSLESAFSSARLRVNEYDADRMAVLELGINIDDAIAAAKRLLKEAEEHELEAPEKETFFISAPLWKDRITHLESLRREAQTKKRIPIDWAKVIQENRKLVGIEQIEITPITNEERQRFLKGIKTIDPTLYDAIIKVDPTGEKHIERDVGGGSAASVKPSAGDGLPKFFVGPDLINVPSNELLFTIAHEMAHYALEHFFEMYTLPHRELAKETLSQEFTKGKKVSGQLPFKETFEKSRSRIAENECDRMAVIDFGISIDDAIARAKRGAKEAEEYDLKMKHKKTLQSTHPMWLDRIKNLEALRSEVELNKERKTPRKKINWEQLAQDYLKKYAQKYGGK